MNSRSNQDDRTLKRIDRSTISRHISIQKPIYVLILVLVLSGLVTSCIKKTNAGENEASKGDNTPEETRKILEMKTTHGTLVLALYNETPLHRDNFVKLAKEGVYDSLLFHRVIENFMIQGGDPDSRFAKPGDTLGEGGLDYKVPAEFNPELFHKKGVLAAARDDNLERASSSTQFYLTQGRVQTDSLLDRAEERINGWLARHYFRLDPANSPLVEAYQKAVEEEDIEAYRSLSDSISSGSRSYTNFETYSIPPDHREVYKNLGGTPHLDQNYTVFGEVLEGLEVIDSVAAEPTNNLDRPQKDARIISVRLIE